MKVRNGIDEEGENTLRFSNSKEPSGIVSRDDNDFTFDDATRTLTISPTGTSFDYYYLSHRHTIRTSKSITISDVEGVHAIYFDDNEVLQEVVNPTRSQFSTAMDLPLVSILIWDATNKKGIYVGEERHGIHISNSTHRYLHWKVGLAYDYGLGLNNFSVDGDGTLDAHAQFGVDAGGVADEDIYLDISSITSTTGLPIFYMEGSGNWRRTDNPGFAIRTYDGTSSTRVAWNEYTGGSWQLSQVPDTDYVLYHIFATTEKYTPIVSVMGQNTYTKKSAARAGAKTEIYELHLNDIIFPEIHPIGTIIVKTRDSYTNSVKGKIVSTDTGDNYIDWRSEVIERASLSTTDHNSLTGLQGGIDGERYHMAADVNLAGTTPTASDCSGAGWTAGTVGIGIGTDGPVWLMRYDGTDVKSVQLT